MSETITTPDRRTDVRGSTDAGDHDRMAHYIRARDWEAAYLHGEAIVALCGKRWVPTRDPERYPICRTCVEVAAGPS